jgi:GAF domain-containing protein
VRTRAQLSSGPTTTANQYKEGDTDRETGQSAHSSPDPGPFREHTLEQLLQQLVNDTRATVSACDLAALTLMRECGPLTIVATDETAKEIDRFQYAIAAGPGLNAYRRQLTYRIGSTRTDPRWPKFARAARERGVFSALSIPLFIGARAVGALNLYAYDERAFSEDDEGVALRFAEQAFGALATDGLGKATTRA